MACPTEFTVTAKQRRIKSNPGTDSQFSSLRAYSLRNITAYSNDLACKLMTRDDRIGCWGKFTCRDVQISSTDATGSNPGLR